MSSVHTPPITPCLWFDGNAHDAVQFYCSVFPGSSIVQLHPLLSTFELSGRRFMALNGGPEFKFTEAISLVIQCENQDEIDYYWDRLREGGGSEVECGWLRDRFGLSWQIVPAVLGTLLSDPDRTKTERVMKAVLSMKKLDIAALVKAFQGI